MNKIFVLTLFLFVGCLSFAQQNKFSKLDSSSHKIIGNSIIQATDNGFMIAGRYDTKGYVFKIDSAGNYLFGKCYSPPYATTSTATLNSLVRTSDSNYVIVGSAFTSTGHCDIICMKIKANGDTIWAKAIRENGVNYQTGNKIHQTYDKGFIITGNGSSSVIVIKLDSSGNLQWERRVTNVAIQSSIIPSTGIDAQQLPDSSYIVLTSCGTTSISLIGLSKAGAVNWATQYYGFGPIGSSGFDMEVVSNGLVCFLNRHDFPFGLGLMKTDFAGNVLWCKKYNPWGTSSGNQYPRVNRTSDGGFVFVDGEQVSYSLNIDMLKVDSMGNLLWANATSAGPYEVIEAKDKGLVLLGNGFLNPGPYPGSIGIVKMDSLGYATDCIIRSPNVVAMPDTVFAGLIYTATYTGGSINNLAPLLSSVPMSFIDGCTQFPPPVGIKTTQRETEVTVSPNPFTSQLNVVFNEDQKNASIQILDLLGKVIKVISFTGKDLVIERGDLSPGVYIIQVTNKEKTVINRKIVVQE